MVVPETSGQYGTVSIKQTNSGWNRRVGTRASADDPTVFHHDDAVLNWGGVGR